MSESRFSSGRTFSGIVSISSKEYDNNMQSSVFLNTENEEIEIFIDNSQNEEQESESKKENEPLRRRKNETDSKEEINDAKETKKQKRKDPL